MAKIPLALILQLDGKTAIVNGGAKGIGRGIAEYLREAGAAVIISDIDEEAGRKASTEVGADFVRADMSSEEDVGELVASAVERHGTVDILINNAGIYPLRPARDDSQRVGSCTGHQPQALRSDMSLRGIMASIAESPASRSASTNAWADSSL